MTLFTIYPIFSAESRDISNFDKIAIENAPIQGRFQTDYLMVASCISYFSSTIFPVIVVGVAPDPDAVRV
jgi:hypothetical protein